MKERKRTLFGSPEHGFVNMGMGSYLSQEDIIEQFNIVANDFELQTSNE